MSSTNIDRQNSHFRRQEKHRWRSRPRLPVHSQLQPHRSATRGAGEHGNVIDGFFQAKATAIDAFKIVGKRVCYFSGTVNIAFFAFYKCAENLFEIV